MLRKVPPAAAERVRILRRDDEVDRTLGRILQPTVVGHAVGFAQGNRREAVAVHAAPRLEQAGPVPFDMGRADQEVQPVFDGLLVLALMVGFAGAQERKEGHRRGRDFGLPLAARIFAAPVTLGSGTVIERPAAVGVLMLGQPAQPLVDRRFAGRSPATDGH